MVAAGGSWLAWLLGRVASDRWTWSQWLAWTPSPVPVVLACIAFALTARVPGRRQSVRRVVRAMAFIVLLGSAFWFLRIEHRFLQPDRHGDDGVRIMHWTDDHPRPSEFDAVIDRMIEQNAAITILSHPGTIVGHERIRAWLDGHGGSRVNGFGIFTRRPILRMERIAREDDIILAYVAIDMGEPFAEPLHLYLIDLPSDPAIPRAQIADRVRALIAEAAPGIPPADMIIGDANIPRGSWSLQSMFPGFEHAFDQAGHGYGATFHRRFPLLHIDQILLAPTLEATDYDIVDPGFGRHSLHAVTIRPRTP